MLSGLDILKQQIPLTFIPNLLLVMLNQMSWYSLIQILQDVNLTQIFPTYHTIFGCCSSFNREISLIAVEGTPSSSDSRRIFFRATNRPDFLFLPLYTTPYVPDHERKNHYSKQKDKIPVIILTTVLKMPTGRLQNSQMPKRCPVPSCNNVALFEKKKS